MKPNIFILIFITICLMSCGPLDSSSNLDPNHTALPDSEVDMETELSQEDKIKLAEAKGKMATPISMSELNTLLSKMEDKAGLCYFWNTSNDDTAEALKMLNELSSQMDSDRLDIFLLNMDEKIEVTELNTMVRELGIDADIFILNNEVSINEIAGNSGKWSGTLPAYYVYNSTEGVGFWFDGKKEFKELYVMMQPFII